MAYTVKKLSELSGVTVRSLHYYEEEGLLKPAYYGSNGYRYYEEKELLRLQQILFFKELGFTISQIKKVLGKGDFDQLLALSSHKKSLRQKQEQIQKLLINVDKTINHIKGKKRMKDLEMFDGFNISLVKKAPKATSYAAAEEIVLKSVRNPTKNIEEVKEMGKGMVETAHAIFQELSRSIEKGLTPSSPEVQLIIKRHHHYTGEIHNASQEVYKALAELYQEHPDFKKQLDPFHPKLSEFMSEAMIHFAANEL